MHACTADLVNIILYRAKKGHICKLYLYFIIVKGNYKGGFRAAVLAVAKVTISLHAVHIYTINSTC